MNIKQTALDSARWIDDQPVESPGLYAGTSGIALFFEDAYRSTGYEQFKTRATELRAQISASVATTDGTGLYTGLAGMAAVLGQIGCDQKPATQKPATRELTRRTKEPDKILDIISGTAGVICYLSDEAPLEATELGDRLLVLARSESNGLSWPIDAAGEYSRVMPNFSHGTAGIAFALAKLADATGQSRFLDAAVQGGRHLESIADDRCFIHHNSPDGQNLYYYGWCHGPVGTSRLWVLLHQITGEQRWLDNYERSARGILNSRIPEQRIDGFWNNVGVCCGSAGVGAWALQAFKLLNDDDYAKLAERMANDIIGKATRDETGTRWILAEHRTIPEKLGAQPGLMQGAAGIARWLLHFDAFISGDKTEFTRLPDEP